LVLLDAARQGGALAHTHLGVWCFRNRVLDTVTRAIRCFVPRAAVSSGAARLARLKALRICSYCQQQQQHGKQHCLRDMQPTSGISDENALYMRRQTLSLGTKASFYATPSLADLHHVLTFMAPEGSN